MIAVVLTGWALLAGAVLSLVAAEIWGRLRTAVTVPRPPAGRRRAAHATARDLAVLAAMPPRQGSGSAVGDLICVRCDRPVDYAAGVGLFCRACELPLTEVFERDLLMPPDADRPLSPERFSPDTAVFEPCHDGIPGAI